MGWINLLIAGLLEIVWAVAMKYSQGFQKLTPSVITILGMLASIYFLAKALKMLPLGIAYPVWTGIGAIGTAVLGIFLFDESREILKIVFILLIVAGIVGLRFVSQEQ